LWGRDADILVGVDDPVVSLQLHECLASKSIKMMKVMQQVFFPRRSQNVNTHTYAVVHPSFRERILAVARYVGHRLRDT
jgi:hypothetical protein